MPKGTISYRIASEVAGIEVAGIRYRATRSARLPTKNEDVQPAGPSSPWTLWHDDRDGGSHTVGHHGAYEALEQALRAATKHASACGR